MNLKCNADQCSHVAKDLRDWTEHKANHLSRRTLHWECLCGTFGHGSVSPVFPHETPTGEACRKWAICGALA